MKKNDDPKATRKDIGQEIGVSTKTLERNQLENNFLKTNSVSNKEINCDQCEFKAKTTKD